MASRFWSIKRDGHVHVKTRGNVGRVVKVRDTEGKVIKWDAYIGSQKISASKTERGAGMLILKKLGILEKNLAGGRGHSRY